MNSTSNAAMNIKIPKRGMPVTIITEFLGSGKNNTLESNFEKLWKISKLQCW